MQTERVRVLSELEPGDRAFDVTDERLMRALREAEDRHFWHRTRNEWIAARLKRLGVCPGARIIELGCGGGCVAAHLSEAGYRVVGVEGQRSLLELASKRAPQAAFWVHDLRRGVKEIPERGFDVVGLFDVLEHLDEPQVALRDACTLVRDQGLLLGTVPALRSLWSRIDELAGHKTRYDVDSLRAVLEGAGEVIEVVPFNRLLVPMLWVQRRLVSQRSAYESSQSNLAVPFAPVNAMMKAALRLEYRLTRWKDSARVQGASLWFALRVPRGGVEPPT